MANNTYPLTTLQPLQKLDFLLANGLLVRTILMPQPNPAGTKVAHVEIDFAAPGSDMYNPIGHEGQPRSVLEAGALAYQIALSQSRKPGGAGIVEVLLEGEEFLERADAQAIIGGEIPVRVV